MARRITLMILKRLVSSSSGFDMSKFPFLHKIIATIVFATLIASSTLDAAMGQPRHRGGCCAAFARLTATLSRAQSATRERAGAIVKNVFHRILGSQPSKTRITIAAGIATTTITLASTVGGYSYY